MGLGKTIQTIAFISQLERREPILVLCPTNVIYNWESLYRWLHGEDCDIDINKSTYAKLHNGPSFYNSNTETIIQQPDIAFSTMEKSSTKQGRPGIRAPSPFSTDLIGVTD